MAAEILSLRKAMWEKISSRAHKPLQIFPFGPNADEVMLYGTVKYGFKAGGESSKDWAARAHLVKEADGKVKMDFYQVYLVRHPALVRVRVCGLKLTFVLGHRSLDRARRSYVDAMPTIGASTASIVLETFVIPEVPYFVKTVSVLTVVRT